MQIKWQQKQWTHIRYLSFSSVHEMEQIYW